MFTTIYDFQVQEALMDGLQVMCLDKQESVLYDMLHITVDEYCKLLDAAHEDKQNRYEFYVWKEAEA